MSAADPGQKNLLQFVSQTKMFYRLTANFVRAFRKLLGSITELFKWNKEFKAYQLNLSKNKNLETKYALSPEMVQLIRNSCWSKSFRNKRIRSQVMMNEFFENLEIKTGFREAKEKNPDLKLVIGLGSYAFSSTASKHLKGLRAGALKEIVDALKRRYEVFCVPEAYTSQV